MFVYVAGEHNYCSEACRLIGDIIIIFAGIFAGSHQTASGQYIYRALYLKNQISALPRIKLAHTAYF